MRSRNTRVRAVVDTNLVISGLISERGAPHQVLAAWRQGRFTLLMTPELLAEYERVLARPLFAERYGLTEEERTAFLRRVQSGGRRVPSSTTLPVNVRDDNDAMILAAALGGNATHLVTGDQDLLVLRDDPLLGALRIVTVRAFLETLETR